MRQIAANPGRPILALLMGLILATTLTIGSPFAGVGETKVAAACSTMDKTVTVVSGGLNWKVTGTYLIRYDACIGWRLRSATCTRDVWWPYTVTVTWCGGFVSGRSLDLGWNASVAAPLRTTDCWARRWAYGAVTGPGIDPNTRSGCG